VGVAISSRAWNASNRTPAHRKVIITEIRDLRGLSASAREPPSGFCLPRPITFAFRSCHIGAGSSASRYALALPLARSAVGLACEGGLRKRDLIIQRVTPRPNGCPIPVHCLPSPGRSRRSSVPVWLLPNIAFFSALYVPCLACFVAWRPTRPMAVRCYKAVTASLQKPRKHWCASHRRKYNKLSPTNRDSPVKFASLAHFLLVAPSIRTRPPATRGRAPYHDRAARTRSDLLQAL
jgi:hypothetical protein